MRPIWIKLGFWVYNAGRILLFTLSCYRILDFSGEVMRAGKSNPRIPRWDGILFLEPSC